MALGWNRDLPSFATVLGDQADRADATASHLQGYLLRGNGLTSEALATLFGQLGPLPEAAETVAA